MIDTAASGDIPTPLTPNSDKTRFASAATWAEKYPVLLASIIGSVGLLLAGYSIFIAAKQIEQAVFTVNFQEFTHCVEQLEDMLSTAQQYQQDDATLEPIIIFAKEDSLFLKLEGGSESPLVVDESSGAPELRVKRRGSIAICRPAGGSEPAFQSTSNPEQYFSCFQRARKLEENLGDAVVSFQYLTLARFAFAYSGIAEAQGFLSKAVACTERSEDGPGKAMMLAQIATLRIKYQKGKMAEMGRWQFRNAGNLLESRMGDSTTVSLLYVYQTWVEAEYRANNIGEAKKVTELLFDAIDSLPVKQTFKNQHIVDAAVAILVEMEMAADVSAEIPLPDGLRYPNKDGEWKSLTISDFKNSFGSFSHSKTLPIDEVAPSPSQLDR